MVNWIFLKDLRVNKLVIPSLEFQPLDVSASSPDAGLSKACLLLSSGSSMKAI
jgi:hypothetical protein